MFVVIFLGLCPDEIMAAVDKIDLIDLINHSIAKHCGLSQPPWKGEASNKEGEKR